ncbi:hypothetical protein [Streptomyces sp. NPDC048577]|uniref:hypothetical protein n=1 Tax=Streptomyces sp. NPDC048577 TaxID=3157209 RepID=UPI0034392921
MLFALLPLFSIGFLTWATMIRLAVVTRRALDWVLCAVSAAIMLTGLLLMPEDTESTRADVAMSLVLLNAAAFTAYFLVADIRHDRLRVGAAPYPPYATTVPRHRSGYVPPVPAPAPTPAPRPRLAPQRPPRQPEPPVVPPAPHEPPAPHPGARPRIDRVRAELDELSHLLRKDEEK